MNDIGPLPEQPIYEERIPHLDLRDRIRLEYNVPPLTPLGKAIDEERARYVQPKLVKASGVGIAIAVALWWINPALLIVAVFFAIVIGSIAKSLR